MVPSQVKEQYNDRSRRPRGIRRRSEAARLLGLWVRIPSETWMSVSCESCVLSCRGLCDGLIIRPEQSYREWCVVVCELVTSTMRRPRPEYGCSATEKDVVEWTKLHNEEASNALWTYGFNPERYDTAIMSAPEVRLIKIFRYRADPIDTVQTLEIVFLSSAVLTVTWHSQFCTVTL